MHTAKDISMGYMIVDGVIILNGRKLYLSIYEHRENTRRGYIFRIWVVAGPYT